MVRNAAKVAVGMKHACGIALPCRMMRFPKNFLTVCAISSLSCAHATVPGDKPAFAKWQFAMSLGSTTTGQLFSLFLVKIGEDSMILESMPITRENFVKQAQGRTFSKANPDADDLFRTYDVKQCTLPPDSAAMGFLTDCSTLDDLWRLRFWEYPLKLEQGQNERLGWAAKPMKPDDRQLLLLSNYGMKYMMDLVIGENFFHLLHDMGDPEWVVNYRGGL